MTELPTEDDVAAAETVLSFGLPDDYRVFLLRENGREYWAGDEIAYVQLYSLAQVLESFHVAETYQRRMHPGLVYIGGDGASEGLAFDARRPDPPLVLVNYVSAGWSEGFYQAPSFTAFLERVAEHGWTFDTPYLGRG
jgi:hypothetical protein